MQRIESNKTVHEKCVIEKFEGKVENKVSSTESKVLEHYITNGQECVAAGGIWSSEVEKCFNVKKGGSVQI